MKILAIEFSSAQRSVAVIDSDAGTNPRALDSSADSTRQIAALSLVKKVLGESRIEREQIEVIAVGLGPGSYNGIRAAIALAQGWQLASNKIKLLGVSSAECLARVAQHKKHFGRIRAIIDAQRNEVYSAVYEINATELHEMKPLRISSIGEIHAGVQTGETIVGPEVKRWFDEGVQLFPEATMVGEVAAGRRDFIPAEKLEPIYLRENSFVKAPRPRVVG